MDSAYADSIATSLKFIVRILIIIADKMVNPEDAWNKERQRILESIVDEFADENME